jgi:hypothetical protein
MDVDLSPRAVAAQAPAPFARTFASVSPTFVVKMRERREHLHDMHQNGVCAQSPVRGTYRQHARVNARLARSIHFEHGVAVANIHTHRPPVPTSL